jgi:hypothetical protein
MRVVVLVVIALILVSLQRGWAEAADNKLQAFGLSFGQSLTEAETLGFQGVELKRDGEITTFLSRQLPRAPTNTEFALLAFHDAFGLQKVVWKSKDISDDPLGLEGKSQYARVAQLLTEKYGSEPPMKREIVGVVLYQEIDEFYQCLNYSGCGAWFSFWEGDFGTASVEIKSNGSRGKGWINVTYEGPEWANMHAQKKSNEQDRDKEAF